MKRLTEFICSRPSTSSGHFKHCRMGSNSAADYSRTDKRRTASINLIRAALSPKKFQYVDQLTQHLKSNFILHEPGRFLIVPKPYGVSCVGQKQQNGGVFKNSVHNAKDEDDALQMKPIENDSVTISDCIPWLSRVFNEPNLQFCVGLKRYLSGPLVLAANHVEFENIRKSTQFASRHMKECDWHHSGIALLMNSPPQDEGTIRGYVTFRNVDKIKEYQFVEGRASKRAKSGKFAVEGSLQWRVLDRRYGCSLVQFSLNKFARHFPRVVFSHLLCPILGDQMYMARMVEIDGQAAVIEPQHKKRQAKQFFPEALASRMDQSPTQLIKEMPLYAHVHSSTFPRFGWAIGRPKSEQDVMDLVTCSPPPPHFVAMVEALEMATSLAQFYRESEEQNDYVKGETQF